MFADQVHNHKFTMGCAEYLLLPQLVKHMKSRIMHLNLRDVSGRQQGCAALRAR